MLHGKQGNTLYLECYSGISGDMTVGALLDLGADRKVLEEQLGSLPIDGFRIEIGRVQKSGLDACDFRVLLDQEHENHDHDNAYLYGHRHEDSHAHSCEGHMHEGHMHHGHGEHPHAHGCAHTHEHRGLPEITSIIQNSGITERAKIIAPC